MSPGNIAASIRARLLKAERIAEDADYHGVRVRFEGLLNRARINMQIDVGFSDVVIPEPIEITYPTILDMEEPQLKGYPRETMIAEKFQAMVHLGRLNSRMKDFYDIWLLAQQFDFNGPVLARSIKATFEQRQTDIDPEPIALQPEFAEDDAAATQWQAFIRKGKLTDAPTEFTEVTRTIRRFIGPVARSWSEVDEWVMTWTAGGAWQRP